MNVEYKKWLTKLLGFDFDIEYKPRLENNATDALSRIELTTALVTLSLPCVLQRDELRKAVDENPELGQVLLAVQTDPLSCLV